MERSARVSRPQLVYVLADNSGSTRGAKASAATRGIREMLIQCQLKGPSGRHRSYFRFVLIRFGSHAITSHRGITTTHKSAVASLVTLNFQTSQNVSMLSA